MWPYIEVRKSYVLTISLVTALYNFCQKKKKKINYDENVNAQVAESYQISRSNIKIMVWDSHSSACDESLQLQGQVAGLLP